MTQHSSRLRQRGVRASRARLEQALAEAGLKTQAALAERIADLEALDTAPKDLVSRVFRERPVDPQTLERVARALGVGAHTLYRNSTDAALTPAPGAARRPASGMRPAWFALPALAAVLLVAAVVFLRAGQQPAAPAPQSAGAPAADKPAQTAPAAPQDAPLSVALLPIAGDMSGALDGALRARLEGDYGLTSPAAAMLLEQPDARLAAERLQVDAVLAGEVEVVGRFAALKIYLLRAGERRLLWADTVPAKALGRRAEALAAATARALGIALGHSDATPRHFPAEDALEDYLAGRTHLDQSRTELNVKRALTRFESALRRSPDYPAAHAGLCEALVQQSILGREVRLLADAEQQCFRALQLDPAQPEALVAWGNVLRKTGRLDEADEAFGRVLAEHPQHTDALLGRAELALERFRVEGDPARAREAVAHARSAVEVEPDFWKAPYVLGRMLYFTDDVAGAVAAVEAAKALDPNEHVLSNLGTFQFCLGDHEAALENYLAAKAAAPEFYVGDLHLGVVHYFLGRYEESGRLFEQALQAAEQDGRPEDHRVWANLADARRHAGADEAAREAYARAAALAERDVAQGVDVANTRAHLAYYYTALLTLQPSGAGPEEWAPVDAELAAAAEAASEAEAYTRLASAFVMRGRLEPARELYRRVTARCHGFGASPDLAVLHRETTISAGAEGGR
jgi:tetratricopeptide (TPR) repeat protein